MKENLVKLTQNIVFSLVISAAVFIPLFFLPTTSEFFEYNKFFAVLVVTIFGFLVWSVKMIVEKRTVFSRSPLDIPFIVLGTVLAISAFSSIDQFISTFGLNGRIWPSLIPLITLIAFYFLTVSNLKTRKQVNLILWVLIGATAIASLVAISSYFGAFLPFDFAHIRSFNPIGVINRLAVIQALVIPIAAAWAIYEKDKTSRIVATASALIMIFSFILVNSLFAYLGLGVALLFLSIGTLRVKLTKSQQSHVVILALFIVLFFVVRFIPPVANGTLYQWIINKDKGLTETQQIDTPKERTLPLQAAWDIAAQAIGKRPLFGTGMGTYQFVYTQLKPRYINSTDDWASRFTNSSSDFTEVIATTGIFGILAFVLFAVSIIRFVLALTFKSQNTIVFLPLSAAILGYMVNVLFTSTSFATYGVFFLLLALLSVLAKAYNEEQVFDVTLEIAALKNRFSWFQVGAPGSEPLLRTEPTAKGTKSQLLPIIFAALVVVISIFVLSYQVQAYRAEYFYRQSLLATRSNDGNKVVKFIQEALQTNPRVDDYHRILSQTALNAAINISQQKNLSDEQKQLLGQLAQVAIDQGKAASGYQILPLRLPGISAANVANWEVLSSAYQALIGSVQGADVHATNTLAQAVALDPQNPILHARLGSLYARLGDTDLAQRKYEDAIIVKGDYGAAHYALANILIEKKGDVGKIANELTLAKRFLPGNDPSLADLNKKLDDYNKQFAQLQKEAQDKATSKTGPDATPKPGTTPSPTASPITSPSPSASPKTSPTPTPSPSL